MLILVFCTVKCTVKHAYALEMLKTGRVSTFFACFNDESIKDMALIIKNINIMNFAYLSSMLLSYHDDGTKINVIHRYNEIV